MMASSTLRSSLHKDGFVVIPSLLKPNELSALRDATLSTAEYARNGNWPHIRTLPKQFPPWTSDASGGIWGVQHLMNPSLPHHELYTSNYFSNPIINAVREILDCNENELVMELYNLLIRPDRSFELRWHRDDLPASASVQEEEIALCQEQEGMERVYTHAQWNMALWDDNSLIVIPGSHRRARTDVERDAGLFKKNLPGMKIVELKKGDVVFYDNNILHRGVYDPMKERCTLHGSMSRKGFGKSRARNVLQHGVGEWVGKVDFSDLDPGMREIAEQMRQGLIEMGTGEDVGYSQQD